VRTQIAWLRRGTAGVAGALCIAALVAVVLLAVSFGGGSGYTVRAIFDDAGNLIPGEDVLIDGVKVGTVGVVVPTPNARAAVTLKIDNPAFQDFRADASCTIKIQSLIGEKNVDCLPTQARAVGTPLPPPLPVIPKGHEGAGQRFLSVEHTSSPVDVDLLGDITRLPERQRLTIILNELGAGLAGRGPDLNAAIRRADPALRELNRVITLLASENEVLNRLAVEGDQALAPLAKVKERISGFIYKSNIVARASANHRGAVEENLKLLPAFLRELGPAMQRLGALSEQITPTATALGIAAPGINKTFENLGPFSKSSEEFFTSLGKNASTLGPALVAAQPFFKRFQTLGAAAKPFADNASALTTSVRETGGIERLVDSIFGGAGATNGYDALGHFLRTMVVVNATCLTYAAVAPAPGCNSHFSAGGAAPRAAAAKVPTTELVMQRTLAVLRGASPAQAIAEYPGVVVPGSGGYPTPAESPAPGAAQPVGGTNGGTTYYTPSSSESPGASGLLLNYLLGN
jgi:phospholipid/cholesterol/gamma-HCH transport system substrate-binding protein